MSEVKTNILDASLTAIREFQAHVPAIEGSALVMHHTQFTLLCHDERFRAHWRDGRPVPIKHIEHVPIWVCNGLMGPAVVDRRTLVMLMMVGAHRP